VERYLQGSKNSVSSGSPDQTHIKKIPKWPFALTLLNIEVPTSSLHTGTTKIFQRKKNTPIRPASLDDLTDTHPLIHKRSHFCKSQSFCLTTLLSIFMLFREARKEVIKTREESNTHHSSKDNKSFLRVPKPITTKPTDRENNNSEHRPIKRFMGMSKRR
jgi:hypothetical protein